MNGRLVNIATQTPEFTYSQWEILDFMQAQHDEGERVDRQLKVLYGRSKIAQRHSVLPDFRENGHAPRLFANGSAPGLSNRLAIYQQEAVRLATQACQNAMQGHCQADEITNVIAVTCTGLFAPGLEFQLIKSLGLHSTVERHPINFVGCYASVPALHLANLICRSNPKAKVLIASVELCTLHMQAETDRDTLTANAIFGDGCAAALVLGPEVAQGPGLELGQHLSEVHPKGETDMTWVPAEKGFLMRLSSYVPLLIREEIREFVHRALDGMGLEQDEVRWAFHPGGAKIISKIREALELDSEDLRISEQVLETNGNMSSATILYVLKEIMEHPSPQEHIFCSAFGPGLTFESIFLRQINA